MRALLVMCVLLASPAAEATSIKLLSLDQLIRQAAVVAAADVTAKEAVWKGRFLKTVVTMKVADCMKGTCEEEEVEVETWGGSKDGLTMQVDGAPQYHVGEKVVVFLRPLGGGDGGAAGGTMHTVGMAQGKFVPAFGREGMLTRDEIGMHLVGALAPPPGSGAGAVPGDGDEPDAGVLDDDPEDPATRTPKAGFDPLQGLTMSKLKGRIKEVAIIRTPGGVNANTTDADQKVRNPTLGGQPPVDNPGGP